MFKTVSVLQKSNELLMRKMVLSSLLFCNNFALGHPVGTETKPVGLPLTKWDEPKGCDTDILIYNPLIKKKTKLILQNPNVVKWYSCGPTVYDSAHIGHASCYVKLDIIRRILTNVFNINVFYLMGITDIDDKIIMRSHELREDFRSVGQKYEAEFFSDLEKLNVLPPTMTVKVSDHIPEIISFVKKIVEKGFGYKAPSGSVYFATKGFSQYGKLYPPQVSENSEKPNAEKRSPLDFTLWKAAKPLEPCWDSPWGPGRPGWHIECSAMASKVLGTKLDIHSGGQDLVFPHHENEEAQSCAYHNTSQWVNYWIHTGHLVAKGDVKMSKSLKNTISISELLGTYSSNHFRMLCLLAPYRHGIEYSPEVMNPAVGNVRRMESFINECDLYLAGYKSGDVDEAALLKSIEKTRREVRSHLANDFDTPRAVEEMMRFMSEVNLMFAKPALESSPRQTLAVVMALQFVKETLSNLGLTLGMEKMQKSQHDSDHRQMLAVLNAAMEFRTCIRELAVNPDIMPPSSGPKAVRGRIFKACDKFRDDASDIGIEIKDHPNNKSTWSLTDKIITKPEQE